VTEYFEICDEHGRVAGTRVERASVHRRGLWHRAVHVWVFHPDGRVYIQRRAPGKDVCPDRLDVSVGEHLQPGEDYEAAAHRGLAEELGIRGAGLVALGGERRILDRRPAAGVDDREIQRLFRVIHGGPVHPARGEIAALDLWWPRALRAAVARAPDDFTPGLRADLDALGDA